VLRFRERIKEEKQWELQTLVAERQRMAEEIERLEQEWIRMGDAIAARGGKPGGVAKINGVKMRVFEVRDPDGHALWFGQSYGEPDQPQQGLLETVMPCMPVSDVAAAARHYSEVFAFTVNHQQDDLAVMDRDRVRLLLVKRTSRSGVGSAYVYVQDADRLYAELLANGAKIERPPVSHPWGLRDFRVYDLEENEIEFGQPFE